MDIKSESQMSSTSEDETDDKLTPLCCENYQFISGMSPVSASDIDITPSVVSEFSSMEDIAAMARSAVSYPINPPVHAEVEPNDSSQASHTSINASEHEFEASSSTPVGFDRLKCLTESKTCANSSHSACSTHSNNSTISPIKPTTNKSGFAFPHNLASPHHHVANAVLANGKLRAGKSRSSLLMPSGDVVKQSALNASSKSRNVTPNQNSTKLKVGTLVYHSRTKSEVNQMQTTHSKGVGTQPVEINFNVFSVNNINTLEQTFEADFFMEAKLPASETSNHMNSLPKQWKLGDWIEFLNRVETISHHAWLAELADGTMSYRFRIRGTFASRFKLHSFPFDSQTLTIKVSAARSREILHFVENTQNPSVIMHDNFFLNSLWDLDPVLTIETGHTQACNSRSGMEYPLLNLHIHLRRRPAYFLWNICLPIATITTLSSASFAVDRNELSSRLNVTLTLVLSAVAFKYVVAQQIPNISYLTLMDKYVLTCFMTLTLVVLQNVLAASLDTQKGQAFDRYSQIVLAGGWVLFHILLLLLYIVKLKPQHSSEGTNDTVAPNVIKKIGGGKSMVQPTKQKASIPQGGVSHRFLGNTARQKHV